MLVPRNNRFGFDLFDDFFKDPLFRTTDVPTMKTDIKEVDNQYVMSIDLPGFGKEDIKISHDNGYLTIAAEKNMDNKETDKEGRVIRQERSFGSCKRTFYIGDNIDQSTIKASFNNGVLELKVPKLALPDKDVKKYIAIE